MADGTFPSLISRNRDSNAADNVIFTQLSDGSAVVTVTGGALNVNIANTSIAVTATDLDIRNLSNTQDNILVYGWDGSSNQKIKTDSNGELQVDVLTMPAITVGQTDDATFVIGTDKALGSGFIADETATDSVDEGDIGIARMTLDRKQLFVLVDKTTDTNRLVINSSGEASTALKSHTITNTNALPISKNNTANSETNPIYVTPVSTAVSGSEVQNYNTAASIAADATSNHDYTVVNTTFLLKSIIVSGSGNIKFEVKVGPLASLVTKAVGFLTGREGDTKQIIFEPAIEVPVTSTGTVRIVRTNRQNQAVDLYSTIIGNDV